MSVLTILNLCSTVSGILQVLAVLYNYKNFDRTLKIVGLFFVVSFISDMTLLALFLLRVRNDMPVLHTYIMISVPFFTAIYYNAFFKQTLKKGILVLGAIAFVAIVYNSFFPVGSIWQYPSVSQSLLGILMIIFSLVYFYQLLNRQEFTHIEKQGMFWINAAVLFYFAINIFLFMLQNRLINKHLLGGWAIHSVVNIIANILFTIGLLCKPQRTTS